ncbi:MAG: DUF4920 domain-containing protein [Holophagaceae bacterium]|nr:DUF4920 domain-containing protein [Holophagaceae bacterium]
MIRKLALILPLIVAAPAMAQQFGKALTLREETKVSDILAKPDSYNGKLVQVRGTIVDVCPSKGCWIMIGGDQRYESILFKVEDGVISFPTSLKGHEVLAEGTVAKMAVAQTEENCEADEKAKQDNKFILRINGLGAVAR